MNLFSNKTCPPRELSQYIFSQFSTSFKEKKEEKLLSLKVEQSLLSKDYSFSIYDKVRNLPPAWDQILNEKDVFLHSSYLTALEASPPQGMQLKYLLLKKGNTTVGVVLLQILDYTLTDSLKAIENGDQENWTQWLSYKVASYLNFKILVVGNLLLSGEHAFYFDENKIDEEEGLRLLGEALDGIQKQLKNENITINGVLFKDTFCEKFPMNGQKIFHRVTFQPNMTMGLHPQWTSFEDYLNQLQSKYRIRAKRAFKKAKDVQVKEWSWEDMEEHKKQLHELYLQIAERADFNMLHLTVDYFPSLKEQLEDRFRLFAYRDKQGELLGFCTLIQNGDEYDAHFLGIKPEANRKYQLYLNMLLDMVKFGIAKEGIKNIVFGRTALEIKSSVGAIPNQMYCYLRHFNPVFNLIIGLLVKKYNPVTEWVPRNPFK